MDANRKILLGQVITIENIPESIRLQGTIQYAFEAATSLGLNFNDLINDLPTKVTINGVVVDQEPPLDLVNTLKGMTDVPIEILKQKLCKKILSNPMKYCDLGKNGKHHYLIITFVSLSPEKQFKEMLLTAPEFFLIKDANGMNALAWASAVGRTELLQAAMAANMSMENINNYGWNLADMAQRNGNTQTMALLKHHGITPQGSLVDMLIRFGVELKQK